MTEYRISIKLINDKEKADIKGLIVSVEFSGTDSDDGGVIGYI